MVGSPTDNTSWSIDESVELPRFTVEPVDVRHVVVPLDGSPFAERAVLVAGWLASALGADVHLVEVVACGDREGAENATRYVDSACRHHHATSWDVVQHDDVGDAIADAVAGPGARLVCLSTHGRGRSPTVGSVAVSVLERSSRPVMLVGPAARAVTAGDAPVAVAVDGAPHDDRLVRLALGWAARLGRRLLIVTVAESAARHRGSPGPTLGWGATDLHRYVESVAARTLGCGVIVDTRVVEDAIDVRDGLVRLLDRTSALVVLGSQVRRGSGPMAPGSHSARIVRDVAVPALVVPIPPA
jgi:nucleotide-binding universal stress UspA family protein